MRSRIVIDSWMRDRVGVALGESYGFLNQGRRITGSRSKIGIGMFSLLDYAGDLLEGGVVELFMVYKNHSSVVIHDIVRPFCLIKSG